MVFICEELDPLGSTQRPLVLVALIREIKDCVSPNTDGSILIPKGRMEDLLNEAIYTSAKRIVDMPNGSHQFAKLEIPLRRETEEMLTKAFGKTWWGVQGPLIKTVISLEIQKMLIEEKNRIDQMEGAESK